MFETVFNSCCVPCIVLESDLHLAMKEAAIKILANGCIWKMERVYSHHGGDSLRPDVDFTKNGRYFLVECETRPSIKRLAKKGRRRNWIPYRTMYTYS